MPSQISRKEVGIFVDKEGIHFLRLTKTFREKKSPTCHASLGVLTDVQEGGQNVVGRCRTVDKEQILVLEPAIDKPEIMR